MSADLVDQAPRLGFLGSLNLALRGLLETGIVFGFGYWGYHVGKGHWFSLLLMLGAPLIGFGFWGLVDFRDAGPHAERYRLTQELVISLLAVFALFAAGLHTPGWTLGIISLVHHGLVYISGDTLLRQSKE